MSKLYPYQVSGVEFLADTTRYHKLLGDDMGLGKTVQVIKAMDKLEAKSAVIICPATVAIHWARKINEWSDTQHSVYVIKDGSSEIPPWASVVVSSYGLAIKPKIARQLSARGEQTPYDVAVFDEAHYLKSATAQRTRFFFGRRSFLHHANHKWFLTGTPILNRPIEIFPILSSMAPDVIEPFTSQRAYAEYFCNGHVVRDCMRCGKTWPRNAVKCPECEYRHAFSRGFTDKGHSHCDELSERLKPFMLRRSKEDVLPELPDKVETLVELDIPAVELTATEDSEYIATVRRELGMIKVPKVAAYIRTLLETIDKVVVFAHHREVLETLHKLLSEYSPVILYGGLNQTVKQRAIDDFVNNPDVRVTLNQIIAGGTGVDGLQGVCNHCVYAELDWSPGVMDQSTDRLRRIGQKDTVFVHYLAVPGSLDMQMKAVLQKKRDIISKIIKSEEINIMSLYPQLLADALEAAVAVLRGGVPATTSKRGKAKSADPTPEVAPNPPAPEQSNPAAAPAPAPIAVPSPVPSSGASREELRAVAGAFLQATPNIEGNRNLINTVIWPKVGATSLLTVPDDKIDEAIRLLKAGPNAYGTAPSTDLSGI